VRPLPEAGLPSLLRALLSWRRSGQGAVDLSPWRFTLPPARPAQLAQFRAELGYGPHAAAMPLAFHYLAVQRAQLAYMLRPAFPHPVIGLIHASQRWQALGPWDAQQAGELRLQARAGARAGAIELQVGLWQHGSLCLQTASDYRVGSRRAGAAPARGVEAPPDGPALARWPLDAAAGRRYARLSGDWNPIHLWPWSARLFGLPRPLIHGLHSAARCEALLCERAGRPLRSLKVRFTRPLLLPGEASLYERDGRFTLCSGDGGVAKGEWD